MKTEEDEAFDELSRRQGDWGMQGSRKHQILRYAESKGTGMKCAVKDCENHAHEGKFVGLLCAPCYTLITGDGGLYSQAYRNSRNMIDTAIAMEREACAKVCEELEYIEDDGSILTGEFWAQAIKARGQA
jgi:hypothetical protein